MNMKQNKTNPAIDSDDQCFYFCFLKRNLMKERPFYTFQSPLPPFRCHKRMCDEEQTIFHPKSTK